MNQAHHDDWTNSLITDIKAEVGTRTKSPNCSCIHWRRHPDAYTKPNSHDECTPTPTPHPHLTTHHERGRICVVWFERAPHNLLIFQQSQHDDINALMKVNTSKIKYVEFICSPDTVDSVCVCVCVCARACVCVCVHVCARGWGVGGYSLCLKSSI